MSASDTGKSAALRGLRWLVMDKPSGTSFIKHGQDRASVTLTLSDGRTVVRERSKNLNCYRIDDGPALVDLRQGVPDDVARLLNIGEVSFARQHDSPYLLSLSPGEAARQLNSVVDLSLIDNTLGNVASEVRKSKSEVEVSRDRLQAAKKIRDGLEWVDACKEGFDGVMRCREVAEEGRRKSRRIAETVSEGVQAALTARNAALRAVGVAKGLSAWGIAIEKRGEADRLRGAVAECVKLGKLVKMGKIDVGGVEKAREAASKTRWDTEALRQLVENIEHATDTAERTGIAARATSAELTKAGKEGCPQCGRPF